MSNIDVQKCKITHYPESVLKHPARPIEKIDESIHALVRKMTEIMFENKGIGLAGPQAGVDLQIFIISLNNDPSDVRVYINPTVTPSGPLESQEEGCLSVPGIYTNIRRAATCTVTATDLNGNKFTEQADGLYARCIQHEYDHLQGHTIADRMTSLAKIKHRKQLRQLEQEAEDE